MPSRSIPAVKDEVNDRYKVKGRALFEVNNWLDRVGEDVEDDDDEGEGDR
jgi:hypothetical protein